MLNIKKLLRNKKFLLFTQAFLVLSIFFNIGSVVYSQRAKYTSSDYWLNLPKLEKKFLNSQYVNPHPTGWIADEEGFSYSGAKLIKGGNPVLYVPDAPPLGKYIIGLSAVLFDNDREFILVSAVLSLIVFYLLGYQVFSNRLLALVGPFLFSFEPIFKNQLVYAPLLDLFQLVFILSSFYIFNKSLSSKRSLSLLILSSLFLGFFISTKFFITGLVIASSWYALLLLKKDKKRIINLTLSLPIALFVLLFSYVKVFAYGYNIGSFLGIQKWVFLYHKSYLILPLSLWPFLLLNKWHVWFGNEKTLSSSEWTIIWPITTLVSLVIILLYAFKKIPKNMNLESLMIWIIFYLSFLSIGQIVPRYMIVVLPMLYITTLYGIIEIFGKYYVKKSFKKI